MTEQRPADQADREAALEPGRSFIVQAPAGSGKTELLTQRFLRLLSVVERPEEIIAITFTRKAAGEMRDRILAALQLGARVEPPAEAHRRGTWTLARAARARDQALGWGLMDNPRRLRIETIDALNAWLARQLPVSSRLGAPPVIAEDPGPVYRRTAREILQDAGTDAPHGPHAAALLRHLGGRFARAEGLLVAMLKARDHWLGKVVGPGTMAPAELRDMLDAALRHFVEDELERALETVPADLREEIAQLASRAAERCPQIEWLAPLAGLRDFPPARGDALPAWQSLGQLLLTGQGGWRKRLDKNGGFPTTAREDKVAMKAVLEQLEERADPGALAPVQALPAPAYDDERWEILAHLLALLPVCAAMLEVQFAARGENDYTGIARAALDALGEPDAPTDLALALDTRISHLLVDEFQDTSQAQVELLERLTAGWTPGDGRSLFCVGDPMQSIYRFREADVGRFLRAQQRGIGDLPLERLQLKVNFRSQAGLVDWVSAVFSRIFPRAPDLSLGAVPFAASAAWHEASRNAPVTCTAVPKGDAQAGGEAVAKRVGEIRAREPGSGIAVLVRSRRQLAAVTPALKAAGIPCRAVEIEPLAEVPAIRDLEALTRALCHRADRTAWLAVLRAPWCGLDLGDLLAVAGDREEDLWTRMQDPLVLDAVSEDGRRRIARVVDALVPALDERGRRPLRRVVEGAWLSLGGPATVENASELQDARSFLEFLDRRARHGDLDDPPALRELLGELYAAPEAVSDDAVQLLTIHKAKGLQFDHVILPGLDKTSGRNEKKLLRWLEQVRPEGSELILAPVEGLGEDSDPLHEALRALDKRRDQLELDRLLYVAATRARRQLHLVAEIGLDHAETGEPPRPMTGTLLERLWPAVGADFLAARVAASPAGVEQGAGAELETHPGPPPAQVRRLVDGWNAPPLRPAARWRGQDEKPPAQSPTVEYDWSGREARAVGIAVHRLLQVIAREGSARWPMARLHARRALMQTLLREAGLGPGQLGGAMARCLAALQSTLADPRGKWLLDPAHAQGASELRISGWLDGQLVNGIVDRSFIDEHGALWIVDYKTGRHEGAELEVFLDREQARYRPQLERYARLMAGRHAGPTWLGLYFPQHAGWRAWRA